MAVEARGIELREKERTKEKGQKIKRRNSRIKLRYCKAEKRDVIHKVYNKLKEVHSCLH
jgi:hypothetical protein